MPNFTSQESGKVSLEVTQTNGKYQYMASLMNGACPFEGHGSSDVSEKEAIRKAILALEKKVSGLYSQSPNLERDFATVVADVSRQSGIEIVLSN